MGAENSAFSRSSVWTSLFKYNPGDYLLLSRRFSFTFSSPGLSFLPRTRVCVIPVKFLGWGQVAGVPGSPTVANLMFLDLALTREVYGFSTRQLVGTMMLKKAPVRRMFQFKRNGSYEWDFGLFYSTIFNHKPLQYAANSYTVYYPGGLFNFYSLPPNVEN